MVFFVAFSGKNVRAQVDMPINLTISEAVKESSKITMRKNYNSGGDYQRPLLQLRKVQETNVQEQTYGRMKGILKN